MFLLFVLGEFIFSDFGGLFGCFLMNSSGKSLSEK
jgi:hypothetical protein